MSWKIRLLFLVIIGFNLLNCISLPLHPDEAYYWVWSHNLALSYFDHPPLIAYFIKLTTLFSEHLFFIRLTAILCNTIAAFFIYKLAKQIFNIRIAEKTLFLFFSTPMALVAFWVTTPDAPLMLFWAMTLYCFYRAINTNSTHFFYAAGISAGFMLLAKYTGILLLASLFIFLLLSSDHRKQFKNKHLYFACCLALLVFSPVIIWNSQYNWASFRFQLTHGMGETKTFNIRTLSEFLGGQIGIFNPIFFLTLIFYCAKKITLIWRDKKLLYLFLPFAFTLLFFGYAACFKKTEANWPIAAYLSGTILLAYWWETFNKKWVYIIGIILSFALVTPVKFPELFSVIPKIAVLKKQFLGYDEIFTEGSRYISSDALILSDTHKDASEAWYYLKGKPRVYILTPSRFSNYNYWRQKLTDYHDKKIVFFGDNDYVDNYRELKKICHNVKLVKTITYNSPYVTRTFNVYTCKIFSSQH